MRPIRIGVDARELVGDTTGVGRYLGELMVRWTSRADAEARQFVLYTPAPLSLEFPAEAASVKVLAGGRGTWWEQQALAGAARRDGLDAFFAPAYTAPALLGVPFAVTIHDLSFSRHPDWFRFREGTRRRLLTRLSAYRARRVITVSEFSRREIQQLYGIPSERIAVIANGVTRRRAAKEVRRERLILYTGSIFNRRRVPDLIAAFARVAATVTDARLMIVGDNRTWPFQDLAAIARSHGVGDRVDVRRYIPDDELTALYARASVHAFLSEYEGFGLTPLEALSARTPVVVLDTPVAREIYRDAAFFVPAGDIEGTADTIARILTLPHSAASVLANAPAVLARYSWDRAAERTLSILDGLAAR